MAKVESASPHLLLVAANPASQSIWAEKIRRWSPQARLSELTWADVPAFQSDGSGITMALLQPVGEGNQLQELLARLAPPSSQTRPYLLVLCPPDQLQALEELLAGTADDFALDTCSESEFACRLRAGLTRARATQAAWARAAELEKLSSRQKDFLSVVSHEIRTPLAAMLSAANILVRYGCRKPDSVERFGRVIQEEGRRLTRLINNLLDLTKIEAGEVEWEPTRFAVAELATQVREAFAALVGERSVKLAVTVEEGVGEIVADRDKLMQVLVNLISNAIKHSPDGGTVYVRAVQGGTGKIRLDVEDEGPGIPPGAEERIFERFQQLAMEDRQRGTGLGLTISREIILRHGGRIWVEPAHRPGALFHVELPVDGFSRSGHGSVR